MNISLFLYGLVVLKGYIFSLHLHSLGHSNSLKSMEWNEFHLGDGNTQEVIGKEGNKKAGTLAYYEDFSVEKECLRTLIYSTKLYWAFVRLQKRHWQRPQDGTEAERGKMTTQEGFIEEMRAELHFEGKIGISWSEV